MVGLERIAARKNRQVSKPIRVLIIEDSAADAALIDRWLTRGGYAPRTRRVETAEALGEALGAAAWDVVLADWSLPRFSGQEALRVLADSGLDIPVIVVTGTIGEESAAAAMRAGARDFVLKDNLTRLVPAIEREMNEAEGRRARRLAEQQLLQFEALKRTDLLKDQFLGIVSHELRTPINAVMGFGSILDDEIAGALTPEQHMYLAKMLAGTETLLTLVNDLLDMSRIQAGRFSIAPRLISFSEVIESVVATLAPLADKKKQTLRNIVPLDLPPIQADEQRIAQVVINLIGNAIKFTPEGGAIEIRGALVDGLVRCEIADTGIGIAAEDVPMLFQRFGQLQMGNTRKSGGTGLGLSITKAIVEAHGGTVGVVSEPDVGSTFWFTLPVAGPANASAEIKIDEAAWPVITFYSPPAPDLRISKRGRRRPARRKC